MAGDDDSHFIMDREKGEMRLTRGVTDRLTTPELHLQVMVGSHMVLKVKVFPTHSIL